MTTLDPGARLVLTQGLAVRPRSTAFWASRPAATRTLGLEVLVQLVMAAITTLPSWMVARVPFVPISTLLGGAARPERKFRFTSGKSIRSCGRLGPASDGVTAERSSERVSEKTGSGAPSTRNM